MILDQMYCVQISLYIKQISEVQVTAVVVRASERISFRGYMKTDNYDCAQTKIR